ncbi:hypothetical protein COO60DRAFT_1702833 [Scenedesmus sp. NREL 46B-D3]|nr:hypothetical protein COO60DRAFT_1702833 [Scenedesmus sp. NREL 46B-D3]
MGSIKAAGLPYHQLDAYHCAGFDQGQAFHAAAVAAVAVHTPLSSSPAGSNAASGSAVAKQAINAIDDSLINHLVLQTAPTGNSLRDLRSKAGPTSHHQQQQYLPHNSHAHVADSSGLTPPAPGDWRLGTDVHSEPSAAAPELHELLSQFPANQHQVLLDSLMASSNPQELLLSLQAAAATDVLGSPLHQQQQALDYGSAHWMQQAMAAAGSSPSHHGGMADLLLHPSTPTAPRKGNQLMQQLQLQASLAAQQAAMKSTVPPPAAASSMSAAQQHLLLQQLHSLAAAAAASSPGAPSQLQQQLYSHAHTHTSSAAAINMWNLAAGLGSSPAAAAAALAAQQQQQQSAMSVLMFQAALAQQQQQHSSMLAAGQYYQQLAAQLMAGQVAAASAPSSYGSLAASSFGSLGSSAPSRASSAGLSSKHDGSPAGCLHRAPSGYSKGRRNSRVVSSSGSSRATSSGLSGSIDVFGYLGGGSSTGGSSRASSYAGSDMDSAADSAAAALAAGLTLKDLCPSSFEDNWRTATAAAASSSSSVSCAVSETASSSSSGRGASSLTSSPGSSRAVSASAAANEQSDDGGRACKAGCPPGSSSQKQQQQQQLSKVKAVAAAAEPASGDAARAPSSRDQQRVAAAAAVPGKQQLPEVGGCPAWFPGAREASGDDSWYLSCPPTCRLFVGNIGSWVDEDALLGYFGKYGDVVDVQVMWNTKMLARGRRVNREFAFISYASRLEAARAVHWLDGCRLPDLEKDRNGITVEYENGEGEVGAASSCSGGCAGASGGLARPAGAA